MDRAIRGALAKMEEWACGPRGGTDGWERTVQAAQEAWPVVRAALDSAPERVGTITVDERSQVVQIAGILSWPTDLAWDYLAPGTYIISGPVDAPREGGTE